MKTGELRKLICLFDKYAGTETQNRIVLRKVRSSNSTKELVAIAKYGSAFLQLSMISGRTLPAPVYKALLKYAKSELVLDEIKDKVPKLAHLRAKWRFAT